MEGLILLGALVVLGFLFAVFGTMALIAGLSRLRKRVAELEERVALLAADTRPRMGRVPVTEAAAEVAPEVEPEAPEITPLAPSTDPVAAEVEGPWAARGEVEPPVAEPEPAPRQDQPIVFRAERIEALSGWLKQNWVYLISAISLAFAGVYFVQYGIENGLLSPTARVAAAVVLGLALVAAGEWLRRRGGATILPSVFAGAGLVSVFAGVVAARQLYGLIGPEAAFAALVVTSAAGVLLGWLHGPLLAAFGLIGAAAAPFVVGGASEAPYWLYAYFVVVTAAGLLIDAMRRWAWVSVLALVLGFGGVWMLLQGIGGDGWYHIANAALAVLAVLVPVLSLIPRHDGPTIAEAVMGRTEGRWPDFPVRLAGGAVAAAAFGMLAAPVGTPESVFALFCLAGLAVALILWAGEAPALSDLAILPFAAFLGRVWLEALEFMPVDLSEVSQASEIGEPQAYAPLVATILLALGLAVSLAAAWRSFAGSRWPAVYAAAAAVAAPATAVLLELVWPFDPAGSPFPWALQVIGIAAIMGILAERFARADGEDRRRAAYATLSCLSLVALALFVLVSKGALTVALGVLVAVAAALDRRFRLPEMGWFIQAGVMVIGWRFVVDPGPIWAAEAPLWEVWLHYLGGILGMVAALVLSPPERIAPRVFLESGIAGGIALFVNVLTFRAFENIGDSDAFWAVSLMAEPWLVVMLAQLYRMQLGGVWLRRLRIALAAVAGAIGLLGLAAAVFPLNPLIDYTETRSLGPPLLDKLFAAYGIPALLLGFAAIRLRHLPRWTRIGFGILGGGLAALYVGLEIRRAFHGDALGQFGVTQGELYAYTVAMLVFGAGLLAAAFVRRSRTLRWAAMTVIAVTVAKVFLIDASGLYGLMRVVSFLGLGLALAGLAVLNRWAAAHEAEPEPVPDQTPG